MNIQSLLSVAIATFVSLGTLLLAMGQSNPWVVLGMWSAAMASLVVNDFKGWVRLSRNSVSLLAVGVVLIYLPSCLRAYGQARLFALADMLICLQVVLLFQKREERVYWWLAIMSVLEVVVAAGFNRGVGFGALLIVYLLLGLFTLSLLSLYGDWSRFSGGSRNGGQDRRDINRKKSKKPVDQFALQFTSEISNTKRTGLVLELIWRLLLMGMGTLLLAFVVFVSVPRFGRSAWTGSEAFEKQIVGFDDQITLGELGTVLESRDDVMQVRLNRKDSDIPLPPLESIYLRGALVTEYKDNQWKRQDKDRWNGFPVTTRSTLVDWKHNVGADLSTEVYQTTSMEANLSRDDLFFVPPLLPLPKNDKTMYEAQAEVLVRQAIESTSRSRQFEFTVRTGGIANGRQLELVPAEREVDSLPLLQMPGRDLSLPLWLPLWMQRHIGVPRIIALANSLVGGDYLRIDQIQTAKRLVVYLRDSGKFKYSLKGEARDPKIDAIEDFITTHPRGDCEYFATALAMMLRSQNIPARVALGYRCDEWDPSESCYRVRQLHAHAWVEAFIDSAHIPKPVYDKNPRLWHWGGWLRLDATPGDDVGSTAADNSVLGKWQHTLSNLQHHWDKYVVEMNQQRQQEEVLQPLKETVFRWYRSLRNPDWWAEQSRLLPSGAKKLGRLGLTGMLLGFVAVAAIAGLFYFATMHLVFPLAARLTRLRGVVATPQRWANDSSIEFYRRFEQIVAQHGYVRKINQTPQEFGQSAGLALAQRCGRSDFAELAKQVVERFYRVRYGREPLDKSGVETVEQALVQLATVPEGSDP